MSITVSVIVALTVFESAMLAEIVRGGLTQLKKGRWKQHVLQD